MIFLENAQNIFVFRNIHLHCNIPCFFKFIPTAENIYISQLYTVNFVDDAALVVQGAMQGISSHASDLFTSHITGPAPGGGGGGG